jgi:hypothetical protein
MLGVDGLFIHISFGIAVKRQSGSASAPVGRAGIVCLPFCFSIRLLPVLFRASDAP